ncbi:autotransporter outer membrane beta-barrel domain-containing protein [Kaistia algarum]|uniref:autotransporter outer membrane beta-barrel domain-containing protein n=1 Tax=Kaistia algarum TaxID=2083279 RepID=UPI00140266CA|nr:autotransporter outer membrane beta-barrel domain-containing protein [Kaistia algarum]MCX5514337.1 autotransporter outer membrane beta-barrel domain-containing protein [Kaistia algarum]
MSAAARRWRGIRAVSPGSPIVRRAGLAILASLLASTAASAQSIWNNTGADNWTTGSNWTPAGEPTAATIVVIDNGGEAQITTPGAAAATIILGSTDETTSGTLSITSGGTLTTSTDTAIIGQFGTGAVTVTRLGSDWTSGGDVIIGSETGSTGTLTVDMSATATLGGDVVLGDSAGSTGTLSVDGAGTLVTANKDLTVGNEGTGFLTVSSGATVDTQNLTAASLAGSQGTVLVTGADSLLEVQGALVLGGAGTASLRIEGSGTLSSLASTLGSEAGGSGTVTLNGDGSSWTNAGSLTIGAAGTGNLFLEAGSTVNTASATAGSLEGGTGTIRITGAGSTLTITGALVLGEAGSGSMTVESGGSVISASAALGDQPTGVGIALVTGDGSSWTNDGLLVIGEEGSATLTVEAAGSVLTGSASLGASAGGTGSVAVTGALSSLTVTDALVVGDAGTGSLDINSAGSASAGSATIGLSEDGSGLVTLSGTGSSLDVANALTIGASGDGAATISLGATATAGSATLGAEATGAGALLVTDAGSSLDVAGTLTVGNAGTGGLEIANGGTVSAADAIVGAAQTAAGAVLVGNDGSALTLSGSLTVGAAGAGALVLDAGGTASATEVILGADETGSGLVVVNAEGSDLAVSGDITIGAAGDGELQVTAGATAESGAAIIGEAATGVGLVTVDGLGSLWTVSDSLAIGAEGSGTLFLSGLGVVDVGDGAGIVTLASAAGSTGVLQIGNGAGAGTLLASEVTGGAGMASLVFDHSDAAYVFAPDITGSISLSQAGSGTTILTGTNLYAGTTRVEAGTLAAGAVDAFSPASDFSVSAGAILDLAGYDETVASLANAGTISLLGRGAGTTLTVAGDYEGTGTVALGTVLGGDASLTDRLAIGGNVSGSTRLAVVNLGGLGAQTTGDGIEIVSVAGSSSADGFTLGRTIAGAYDYRLYQGGTGADSGNGSWYLRSDLSAAAQTYRAYPSALLAYSTASIGTLEQRTGGWSVGSATTTVPGGAFVRGAGLTASASPETGSPYQQDLAFGQTGIAGELPLAVPGLVTAGVTATFGRSQVTVDTRSHGTAGTGRIDSDAYGFGGTLTYWGRDGLYADAVGQVTYFDTGISVSDAATLASANSALGTALSLEIGKRFEPAPTWSIVPQAQLLYASVGADDWTDADGTTVTSINGQSLIGRAGLRLEHAGFIDAIALDAMRYNAYVIANLYYAFVGNTDVAVGGTTMAQEPGRLTGQIGLGGTLRLAAGTSLYGEASYASALDSGDAWSGNFGLRVQW